MGDLLAFLNANSGALNVIFTGVVTIATAVYAVLTWKLVSETRQMREVQTEPKIEITLRSVDEAIHIQRLQVRNIGLGPALQLTFRPKVLAGGGGAQTLIDELTKTNFFTSGLSYLGPGEQRYSHYTQMTENYDAKIASVIAFDLKYKSATGKDYQEALVIDMSEHKGSYQLGKPHLYSIAQSLEKIQKDLGHVVSGFKRIRTDVYTSEDREAENSAIRERIDRERAEPGA
jgi:hypothetical protein